SRLGGGGFRTCRLELRQLVQGIFHTHRGTVLERRLIDGDDRAIGGVVAPHDARTRHDNGVLFLDRLVEGAVLRECGAGNGKRGSYGKQSCSRRETGTNFAFLHDNLPSLSLVLANS